MATTTKRTTTLHKCLDCTYRRTRGERCAYCARRFKERERIRAKLARTPGTVANIGALTFLRRVGALMEDGGFTVTVVPHNPPPFNPSGNDYLREQIAKDCTCKWPVGHDRRCPATDDYLRLLGYEESERHQFEMHLEHDALHVQFVLRIGDDRSVDYSILDGSTTFSANADGTGGSRTFDRIGIEQSFYANVDATPETVRDTLLQQLERVQASRERITRSVTVPGLPGGWMVTPEQKINIAATLRSGKAHNFMPSGFGTGYRVCPSGYGNQPARRAGFNGYTRLPDETSKFFGVAGPLFYDTLDCD
jgi:hypothetical protein